MCTCVHSCMCMYACAAKDGRCGVLPSLSLDSLETGSLTEPEAQALSSTQLLPTHPCQQDHTWLFYVGAGILGAGFHPCAARVHAFLLTGSISRLLFCCLRDGLVWFFFLAVLGPHACQTSAIPLSYTLNLHQVPSNTFLRKEKKLTIHFVQV